MKKLLSSIFILISVLFFSCSFAAIQVYESPNTHAKVILSLNSIDNLSPFYSSGEWIKVGDRSTGQVGWVKKSDFHSLNSDFTNSSEYYFVSRSQSKKGDKIEAYQNGQRLTDQEAKRLYHSTLKREKKMNEEFRQMHRDMEKLLSQFQNDFDDE